MTLRALREDWRVAVGVISGGHFFSHLYLLAFPPLFPLLADEFVLTNAELGLIVSAVNLTGLLQTPVGEVVDRVGSRRIFVGGIVLTAGGTALTSLAENYVLLLVLVVIAGLGQPAFHPADYAMLDTVTDEDTRGKAYSLHSFMGWAGFAAAPLFVGSLGFAYGWKFALVAAGAAGLVYAALSALLVGPHYLREIDEQAAVDGGEDARTDRRTAVREAASELLHPAILTLFGFFLILIAAVQALQSFIPILATDGFGLPPGLGNTALTALPALAAVGVLLGGVLADRYLPRRIVGASLAVATALLWVGLSGVVSLGEYGFVAVFGAVGFFVGVVNPARDKLVSQYTPPGATGKTFGFVFTGLTVGAIVGPFAFGAAIDATSVVTAFLLVGGTLLVAAAVSLSFGTGLLPLPAGPDGER